MSTALPVTLIAVAGAALAFLIAGDIRQHRRERAAMAQAAARQAQGRVRLSWMPAEPLDPCGNPPMTVIGSDEKGMSA